MRYQLTGRFTTDFYGSAPAAGKLDVLYSWLDTMKKKSLLSFAERAQMRGQKAEEALEVITSIFHRDGEGCPILGNWMLRRCLVVTGETIFDARKDNEAPSKDKAAIYIGEVNPFHINIYNGSLITAPAKVEPYAVSIKKPARSFFKAYEVIPAGTTFNAQVEIDDQFIAKKYQRQLLKGAGKIGVGAFRERYGKFEWTKGL